MVRKKINHKDKKLHREFVWLASNEYEHLCTLLGKEETERLIEELNLYLGQSEKNQRKYDSHYYTIQVWARRAGKSTFQAIAGDVVAAKKAADRVIEALKDPANKTMPTFDQKTTQAAFAVMRKRMTRWPDLREMRHDGTYLEEIHAAIREAYSRGGAEGAEKA
jgi:hypothetical protein